jgi:hypothetical protein
MRQVGFFEEEDERGNIQLPIANEEAHVDEPRIVQYLDQGQAMAHGLGSAYDLLDPSHPWICKLDILSDGEWAWPRELGYYVKKYHVTLPAEFLAHMASNNWVVPTDIRFDDDDYASVGLNTIKPPDER